MKPTLIIGDVHGHFDRLSALLTQEGIIEPMDNGDCRRINHDVEVVQLGDLGHFGKGGSPTGDLLCYLEGQRWLDVILWGNHDRAVVDSTHMFTGYTKPRIETYHLLKTLRAEGKLKLAHEAHGWVLTHAGLSSQFKNQNVPERYKTDAAEFVQWINWQDKLSFKGHFEAVDREFIAVRDAISPYRGGRSRVGGILWRDIREGLHMKFPQVFGHTADLKSHSVRYCWERGNTRDFESIPEAAFDKTDGKLSYCIDIGGKGDLGTDQCLMGLWLPEQRIVRVDLGVASVAV